MAKTTMTSERNAVIWSDFSALRASFSTPGTDDAEELVVEGQLMHQRRISRKCSFFDLASVGDPNDRLEVILKLIDDELSIDEVEAIRHRIKAGDVVHVRGFMERLAVQSTESDAGSTTTTLLLHARDIVTVRAWKDLHPGVTFVPVPTATTARHRSPKEPDTSASAPTQPRPHEHCKFWINSRTCQYGDKCKQYHAQDDEFRVAHARWLETRLQLKRKRAMIEDDPLDPHGKTSKFQRAVIFVEWLIETFGAEFLAQGSGVIDVAGGRGNVSFELWNKRQIPTTLVDPRPMKLSRVQYKHFKKMKIDKPDIPAALAPQKLELFNTTTFVDDPMNLKLLQQASVLVGMHPDEATDAIFDVAVAYDKPFAVVPCCVFGQKFPERRLPDGTSKVVSYEDLVEYLMAKHPEIQRGFLPFDGKNLVLYRLPPGKTTKQDDEGRPPSDL